MNRASLTVVLVALAGCSTSHPVVPGDAGAGDAGPDAAPPFPPPNTVVGKSHLICHQLPADVDLPEDLSQSVIQAWIPDNASATGYRVIDGTGTTDGTFTITGVPDGTTYLLNIDGVYDATDQHVIDVHNELGIRCVPSPAVTTVATPVTLDVAGMTPYIGGFPNGDSVEIDSYAAGYVGGASLQSVLQSGDVAISTVYNWLDFGDTAPLPDATVGDDLNILHYRSDPAPDPGTKRSHAASYLLDWFPATGVTLQSGVAQTISGLFQPATRDKRVSFSIDRSLFDAGLGTSSPFGISVTLSARPLSFEDFPSASLASFDLSDSASRVQTVSNYAYADPFPASWKRTATVAFFQDRSVRYPDPAHTDFLDTIGLPGFTQMVSEYTGTLDTTPVPPPGGATIGGVDFVAGGNVAFDGRAPVVVTWNPVPSATTYRVEVIRINPPAAADRTTFVAILRTADTSIKIPAELFSGGQFYGFILMATRTPNDYGAGFLRPIGVPDDFTSYGSGRFRLSPSCGDGTVQAGEDCDTRGESTTCNVDCTVSFCGDGLRNAAAGEACDTVNDTPSCDSDCTLPVCGDNHLNRIVEDCDDGNTTDDGNGCGTDCKFNNVCGNGHVESLVEQCDPGPAVETATCNFNCTIAFCGDGIVNKAAGEECDDANQNDTDHCSNACKIQ